MSLHTVRALSDVAASANATHIDWAVLVARAAEVRFVEGVDVLLGTIDKFRLAGLRQAALDRGLFQVRTGHAHFLTVSLRGACYIFFFNGIFFLSLL